jgi:protein-tyrosine-phosphatase
MLRRVMEIGRKPSSCFPISACRSSMAARWRGCCARSSAEDRAESRRAGFDAHVAKPADPETIDSILNTVFARGPA